MFDKKSVLFKGLLVATGIVATISAISIGVVIGVNSNKETTNDNSNNSLNNLEKFDVVFSSNLRNQNTLKASDALKLAKENPSRFFSLKTNNIPSNYSIDFSTAQANDDEGQILFNVTILGPNNTSLVYKSTVKNFLPNNYSEDVLKILNNFRSFENPGLIKITELTNAKFSIQDFILSSPAKAVEILVDGNNFRFSLMENSIPSVVNFNFNNAKISRLNSNNSVTIDFEIIHENDLPYVFSIEVIVSSEQNNLQVQRNQLNTQLNHLKNNLFNNSIPIGTLNSNSFINFVNFQNPTQKIASQLKLENLRLNTLISNFNEATLKDLNLFSYSLTSIDSNNGTESTQPNVNLIVRIESIQNRNVSDTFQINLIGFLTLENASKLAENNPILKNLNTRIETIFTPAILSSGTDEEINAISKSLFEQLYNLPSSDFGFIYSLKDFSVNFITGELSLIYEISGQGLESPKTYTKIIGGFLKRNQEDFDKFNQSNASILRRAIVNPSANLNSINSIFSIKNILTNDSTGKSNLDLETIVDSDIEFSFERLLISSLERENSNISFEENFLQLLLKENFNKSFITNNFDFISNNVKPTMKIENISISSKNLETGILRFSYDLVFNSITSVANSLNPLTQEIIIPNNIVEVRGFKINQSIDQQNLNLIISFLSNEQNFNFPNLNKNARPSSYTINNFQPVELSDLAKRQVLPNGSNPQIIVNGISSNDSLALVSLNISIIVGNFSKTEVLIVKGFVNPNQAILDNASTLVNFTSINLKNLLPSQVGELIITNSNFISNTSSAQLRSLVAGFSFGIQSLNLAEYEINIIPNSIVVDDETGKLNFEYKIKLLNFNEIISTQKTTGEISGFLTNDQNNLNNAIVTFFPTPKNVASLEFLPSEINETNFKQIIENVMVNNSMLEMNQYNISNLVIDRANDTNGVLRIISFDISHNMLKATLNNSNSGYTINNLKSTAQKTLEQIFSILPNPLKSSAVSPNKEFKDLVKEDFEVFISNNLYRGIIVSSKLENEITHKIIIRIEQIANPNIFIQYEKDFIL
ncbi:hypothetical protein [[Mycoplasma] mobile]|uniref:Expressed protein n=1 Tax=Mycoplasma mobile (strain ATCC 43663 / 163K / NCTC 11711) TaxID=267748 RepID=Q6KHK3_MYCM1|nr:hypothetical protein [[Mycoplasma] mobile]AAT27927.1 expressed protein [Mycoplasma mobile 163K]